MKTILTRWNLVALALACMLTASSVLAGGNPGVMVGIPTAMGNGITETVATIMARDATATAQAQEEDAAPNPSPYAGRERSPNPASPLVATYPLWAPQQQSGTPVAYTPQTLGLVSFTGGTLADSGFVPPDTMGAVGPKQFIVAVNGLVRSFNKTTGVKDNALDTSTDNFFASVRNASTSDPRIRFDRLTQRWFVIMIDVGAPNRILIAVSNSAVISAKSSFTFFQFTQDAVPPTGDTGCLMDYPSIGIDVNAIYIGGNQFNNGAPPCPSFAGGVAFVVRKSSVLGAGPIVVSAFRGLTGTNPTTCPSSGGDSVTPQGVDNDDPSATNGYFVADSNCSSGIVNVRRVSDPGGTPTLTADIPLTVPMNDVPLKVEHLGNNHPGGTYNGKIDGNDNRPIQSRIVNGSIYTTQGVSCGATGVSDPNTAGFDDRDCVRFYQIDPTTLDNAPPIFPVQAGTIFDSTAVNPLFYTYGSMAVSGQGHAAFSFSSIGVAQFANGATTGRLATDPPGFTYTPTVNVTAASVPYDPTFDLGTSRARRWGDYSAISVDPDDNMTMWGVSEYTDSNFSGGSWGVRINQLLAPAPTAPASASPSSTSAGSTASVTVSGGTGFYDPGAGFPKHISASVSGGGVSVLNATWANDPTSVQLDLAVSNGATTGARDITITNPDGQSATGTGIFTVNASGCSGAALSSAPDAVLPNGSIGGSYNEQFSVTGGGAGPYTFSFSGNLPAGTGLSAGGNLTGTLTADGVYNFSITADDGVCPVVQAYSVTVDTNYISVQSGTPQSTWTTLNFSPLKVQVLDGFGNPVGGVTVTFTAPVSGATGTFPGNLTTTTAITDATFGVATSPIFTANNTVGSYQVVASINPSATVNFNLSNVAPEIVTNTNDSGPGSLRQVLSDAPDGATVNFQAGLSGTITLTSGQLPINNSVSIPGPGARTLTVNGNAASRVFQINASGNVSISGLTITNGKATNGAGIQINSGAVALTDLSIVGNVNSAGGVGAGVDLEAGSAAILRCTIANNATLNGSGSPRGAIFNRGQITLTNSTVTGNTASSTGTGGALRNIGATATFTAINSTITNNTAATGGNLAEAAGSGAITLQNTIVAGGVGGGSPDISGTVVSADYNLIQSTAGATITGTTTHNITGVSPNLGALANNGGQTDTRLPNASSPVIDKGGTGGPATDQRGMPRPFENPGVVDAGDGSDIGAVEVQNDGISATGSASPDSGIVGTTSVFTVNVTGGFNPPSTGISVTANLVDFGGTATQAFTDNGGGVFTFNATVAPSAALGSHQIAVSVSDAQTRFTGTSIAFEVMSGGTLGASGSASPSSVAPSASTLLTVHVTAGTNPASSGIVVTADLSSINGSATQAFLDDGLNGDAVAGDGIYSYNATVPLATIPGSKNLLASVSDAQGRTGAANIALTVLNSGALSGSGSASPSSVAPSGSTLLTVTPVAGTNPASTSITVTGDLTSIGGSATQQFYDDGTHGDATANDGTFSFSANVPLATVPGSKNLPVTISDAQSRSATVNIGLTILTPSTLSATASASPNSGIAGTASTFTVTVSSGTNPTSTGVTVTADLTDFGGTATQAFTDNGGGSFTFSATVQNSAAPGLHVIPVSIADAQGRTANASIAFNVPAPGALSGSGLAEPGSVGLAGDVTLLVSVIPGTSPDSSGLTVTANLAQIGGDPAQTFYDDGTHGDQTAGDHVYTFVATVPSNIALGTKLLPVTIGDAQARSGSATIQVNVVQGSEVIFANGFE